MIDFLKAMFGWLTLCDFVSLFFYYDFCKLDQSDFIFVAFRCKVKVIKVNKNHLSTPSLFFSLPNLKKDTAHGTLS